MYDNPQCIDLLSDGTEFIELTGPRYETDNTHGGGDTMASAITASLAKGLDMPEAVAEGKKFIDRCVAESYPLGGGVGPVSPFWRLSP
jgi:hydroxymethylpyrimidine/phosphomethylpyrimidine kinase